MSKQTAAFFLLLALAAVHSLEDALVSSKGRTLNFADDNVSPVYFPLLNAAKDPAAGVFTVIGGVAADKPCCTSWGPGRVDCFIRGTVSEGRHWWKDNGKYHPDWVNLGGVILGPIECVSRAPGILDILAVGQNLALYVNAYTATRGTFTGWQFKGSRIVDTPSCVSRTATTIDCMVRNGGNKAFYIDQINGRWTAWASKNGLLGYPSKTSIRSETVTDYWHVGSNSNLWQIYRSGRRWGRWSNLGGLLRGQAEVVSLNPKRLDVLVTSTRNTLMHLVWNGNWQKWVDLGGNLVESPSCVAIEGIIHCFMVQMDSYLYRRSYDGKAWSDWFCSYGSFLEGPKCVVSNLGEKEVSCYLRGFNRKIVEMVYKF